MQHWAKEISFWYDLQWNPSIKMCHQIEITFILIGRGADFYQGFNLYTVLKLGQRTSFCYTMAFKWYNYIDLDLSCLLTPKSVLYYLLLSGKWWLPKNQESVTQDVLIIIYPLKITYLLTGGGSRLYTEVLALFSIHYFGIYNNASCLPPLPPPQILHNHCFQFLLGITVVVYWTSCPIFNSLLSHTP